MPGERRRRKPSRPTTRPSREQPSFLIPEKAQRLLETTEQPDAPQHQEKGGNATEALPPAPRTFVGGYAGFVCAECRAPVDFKVRGRHKPGCPNEIHNEGLDPWLTEDDDQTQ